MAKKDSAFSMLELLVVLLIMGVIAAAALPNAINFLKVYRLHADASGIASQLNVVRFRAASQYTPYSLHFDTSANTFTMNRLDTAYSNPSAEVGPLPLSLGISFLTADPVTPTPATVSGTNASTDIYFNTRGLPVTSAGVPTNNSVVYLKNTNNVYDAVTVSLGGASTVWNYSAGSGTWIAR